MQKTFIKQGGKILGYLYSLLDFEKTTSKKKLIESLVKEIRNTRVGFAGFAKKEYLEKFLERRIFYQSPKKGNFPEVKISFENLKTLTQESLIKCQEKLPIGPVYVFIFPIFTPFVKEKMDGITGFTPWKNTVHIFIHPEFKDFKENFLATFAHEYNHAAVFRFHRLETLIDYLIFEGLAEHFKEEIVPGKKSAWVKAVPKSELPKYFEEIRSKLFSKDKKIIDEVFFGTGRYPLWLGYSLGYWIANKYFKRFKVIDWVKTVKDGVKEIKSFVLDTTKVEDNRGLENSSK